MRENQRIKMAKKSDRPGGNAIKPDQYSYNVAWSEEDEQFIGRVAEFPSLAAHGSSQVKALREIRAIVSFVLEDLAEAGEQIPVPLGKRNFSGRLNLRMPKDLHRRLALESETQGVSLNSLINSKLQR
jgi:predicted HicB family RNase H-like nuclease